MYYEERIMDGRLWSRSTPDGRWTEVPYMVVLGRMLSAERQMDSLRARADGDNRITLREALASKQQDIMQG